MKKKILALFLCAVMVLSLFAVMSACNDKDKTVDKLPNLTILYESDANLKNTYSMLAVDPAAPFVDANGDTKTVTGINTAGADAFINWMSLASTRELISNYGAADYGEKLFYLDDTATVVTTTIPKATDATKEIRLSTTTSVNDSGLMQYVVPTFEKDYGYTVKIASAGTGAAINAAKYGNADMILVHSKSQEETFVAGSYARKVEGFSAERITFMYNYFVLVGPTADPAKVKDAADIKAAFAAINATKSAFISRGDLSGTHTKEASLWDASLGLNTKDTAGKLIIPATLPEGYTSAGQGMGACLTMANEKNAYVLSDKATYLTYKNFKEE